MHELLKQVGRRYRFKGQEFWAEDGIIRMEDVHTGDYKLLSRKDMLLRAQAFNSELAKKAWPDERVGLERLVQAIVDCVREAKAQGDPLSVRHGDEVIRNKAKELTRQTRAAMVTGPAGLAGPAAGDHTVPADFKPYTSPGPQDFGFPKTDVVETKPAPGPSKAA